MLRITIARLRIFFAVMGCAILGASLVDWAQGLRATETGYAWVNGNSPNGPAIETAEIWQASARCMRPFFADAVLRSKARLQAYYDRVPAEVRASRMSAAGAEIPRYAAAAQDGDYRLVSDRQNAGGSSAARLERGAMLHARYAEWYANVFKLEVERHRWEERLRNVADQSVTVGEATRRSFSAGRGRGRDAAGDFDRNLLALLGLDGFPADVEQALRAHCVSIVPVKRVLTNASYFGELYRWPLDHAAAFSFGLELLFIAIFFVPIDLWLGTGNMQAVRRHLVEAAARAAAKTRRQLRNFALRSFEVCSDVLRAAAAGTRAIFTARTNSGASVGQIRLVAKLAELDLPLGKAVEWLKRAGANRFDDRFA